MAIIKISDLPQIMDLEQMMTVRGGAPGDGSGDGGLVCLGESPVTCNGTTGITRDGGSGVLGAYAIQLNNNQTNNPRI